MNTNGEGALHGVEAARERVGAQVRAAEQRQQSVEQLVGELQTVSETVRSARGEVEVTAQPSGRVVDLRFSASAEGLSAAALSRVATETIALAQHAAAMAAVQRSAELLGESSEFVSQLRHDAETAYPKPGAGDSIRFD